MPIDLGLKDPSLLKMQPFLGGEWVATEAAFGVLNPATGKSLCRVQSATPKEVTAAIDGASQAFAGWSERAAKDRASVLMKWHNLIIENADDLALLMTLEQGKPLAESKGEVGFGASFVSWYAEEAKRVHGEILQTYNRDRRVLVFKQPVGVVVAITPWNFPSAMITRKCAPALAAGCTVVLKPAEDTPLSALALAELANRAGVPRGVISVLPTSPADTVAVGAALLEHPSVRKLSFTGSTQTGKILMRGAANNMLKVSLELGGNAPMIVFEDADIDKAVVSAIASKFRNNGQTCTCTNRILVQETVYDEFIAKFVRAVGSLKLGNGLEEGITMGPLINAAAVSKVDRHVKGAIEAGAELLCGGKVSNIGSLFYEPTVLTNVHPDAEICIHETFGPVAPVVRFKTEEEAIEIANSTRYGLAAYFFTRDLNRVLRVSEKLEFGAIGVNEAVISSETVPIGGMKESGIGREGAHHGIEEFLEVKQVTVGGLK